MDLYTRIYITITPTLYVSTESGHLRGQGGLHENFAEIEILVVSDREDRYLSDTFGPMKEYCS